MLHVCLRQSRLRQIFCEVDHYMSTASQSSSHRSRQIWDLERLAVIVSCEAFRRSLLSSDDLSLEEDDDAFKALKSYGRGTNGTGP